MSEIRWKEIERSGKHLVRCDSNYLLSISSRDSYPIDDLSITGTTSIVSVFSTLAVTLNSFWIPCLLHEAESPVFTFQLERSPFWQHHHHLPTLLRSSSLVAWICERISKFQRQRQWSSKWKSHQEFVELSFGETREDSRRAIRIRIPSLPLHNLF